jgi:hypothetical protein
MDREKNVGCNSSSRRRPELQLQLGEAAGITESEWETYRAAMHAVRGAGPEFMLGGGFAQAAFTGRWRNTKDIDLYVMPGDRNSAVNALTAAGFQDYFSTLAYDRNWIYRSVRNDVIVDIIWSMANQRAQVDRSWVDHASTVQFRDEYLKILPMEEFMWCKLYILQRDRCDWIDIFNLLYSNGASVDWERLLGRLGEDWPLLAGVLNVYGWLHPERALQLPQELRQQLGLAIPPREGVSSWEERVRLLDSRAWFSGLKGRGERLEI